jgi:hypothetical protein
MVKANINAKENKNKGKKSKLRWFDMTNNRKPLQGTDT